MTLHQYSVRYFDAVLWEHVERYYVAESVEQVKSVLKMGRMSDDTLEINDLGEVKLPFMYQTSENY